MNVNPRDAALVVTTGAAVLLTGVVVGGVGACLARDGCTAGAGGEGGPWTNTAFPNRPEEVEPDVLKLTSNDGDDQVVVLLSGAKSQPNGEETCLAHGLRRGKGSVPLGNMVPETNCRSEVSVFSVDDAAVLVEAEGLPWTFQPGDEVTIELAPGLLRLPLTVWVVATQGGGTSESDRAADEVALAGKLLNSLDTGIGLNFDPQADLQVVEAQAGGTITTSMKAVVREKDCGQLAALVNTPYYASGQINVYYVPSVYPWNGFHCGRDRVQGASGPILAIATYAGAETLTHELGHSTGLGDLGKGVPDRNLMRSGSQLGRDNFTIGQAFRMNLDPGSVLNDSGIGPRKGPTRDCKSHPGICPSLMLDASAR